MGTPTEAIKAVKQGNAIEASKQASRPLVDACKALWRAGGMRSLFAGMGIATLLQVGANMNQEMVSMSSRSCQSLR